MFTTGSKLFLGATALAMVATIVFGITEGGVVGWTATVSLVGVTLALAVLAGVNIYGRDGNVSAMDAAATTESTAAQDPPTPTMWPALAALALGVIVVGLVTSAAVFKIGLVLLLAVIIEWMVVAWSEQASVDRTYNAGLRQRILHPLEFPVLAAIGLGIVIYSFSRIMLFISKTTGPAIFGIVAALVLLAGVLFAYSPGLKKSVAIGVCTIAALGLVSTGAVMAIDGEREIHAHEIIADDPSICSSNEETEADHHASQSVAAKSSVAAEITLADGVLTAHQLGAIDQPDDKISLPRANPSVILFHNADEEEVRLVAHLGAFPTDVNGTTVVDRPVTCTALVEQDGTQSMVLRIPRSSVASSEPYQLTVPGIDSAITVEVP
jgi:hypothetical protein